MIRLGIARDEPVLGPEGRRWRREARSAWLRLAVLVILVGNLLVGEHGGLLLVHANVVVGYGLATVVALGAALSRRGPTWLGAAFVVVDALAVVALLHEHLYAKTLDHTLSITSLAIAFVLMNHVSLRLRPGLILLYAGLVLVGWLSLLVVSSALSHWRNPESLSVLAADSMLAVTFAFAGFVAYLLVIDHNVLLKSAMRSERRRANLSRFFSPDVVAELQGGNVTVELERRAAAVMFVDLRSFTRYSESAPANQLAELLVDYRTQVTKAVFEWGGTVDKFIGDGVMAVFGHPRTKADDAERAIRCALDLSHALVRWKNSRMGKGQPALDAGIGLHMGLVIGGVLESGQHDEFTVLGDAVNVSQRLERWAKALDAALVISAETLELVPSILKDVPWVWKDGVELEGRSGTMRVAFLPRASVAGQPTTAGR